MISRNRQIKDYESRKSRINHDDTLYTNLPIVIINM